MLLVSCALGLLICFFCCLASADLDADCFRSSGITLVTPSNGNAYDASRAVFNQKIQNTPAAIAYVKSEADVIAAVRCALAGGMKPVAR